MKRKRFTEEQIIGILRAQEACAKTGDLARKHGVSEATLYNWKAKFGGMDVSDAKRLKALEDENGKLKRLLADAMLDNTALKDLLSKNVPDYAPCSAILIVVQIANIFDFRGVF
jgi:putative transposase